MKIPRGLFLFLWGFTLVTKLCFQGLFPPQNAFNVVFIHDGCCFVGKIFLPFGTLDSDFRLHTLKEIVF